MATGDDDLRPTTMTMATARRATKLTMMATTTTMAMGGNNDGDGATGDTSMAMTRWRRHDEQRRRWRDGRRS